MKKLQSALAAGERAAGAQHPGHQVTLVAHGGQEPSCTWLPDPMQRLLTNSLSDCSELCFQCRMGTVVQPGMAGELC